MPSAERRPPSRPAHLGHGETWGSVTDRRAGVPAGFRRPRPTGL